MARVDMETINVLRNTANKLKDAPYMWGHMGMCNCGNLAQEITGLTKAEIHRTALTGSGNWTEQLNDYCDTSSLPFDLIISKLMQSGFTREDLMHLEHLSDAAVLEFIPKDSLPLSRNNREDAILYLIAWSNMLEGEMLAHTLVKEVNEREVLSLSI